MNAGMNFVDDCRDECTDVCGDRAAIVWPQVNNGRGASNAIEHGLSNGRHGWCYHD
jgi:hypothetical protein